MPNSPPLLLPIAVLGTTIHNYKDEYEAGIRSLTRTALYQQKSLDDDTFEVDATLSYRMRDYGTADISFTVVNAEKSVLTCVHIPVELIKT